MTEISPIPDNMIHDQIIALPDYVSYPLRLIDLKVSQYEDYGKQSWQYIFQSDNSSLMLKVGFTSFKGGKVTCICFLSKDRMTYIMFDDYLKYIKNDELLNLKRIISDSMDPVLYVKSFLEILVSHLDTGL